MDFVLEIEPKLLVQYGGYRYNNIFYYFELQGSMRQLCYSSLLLFFVTLHDQFVTNFLDSTKLVSRN